ncbi:MAG: acyl carrier protein [Gemmatimonadales bacterium]
MSDDIIQAVKDFILTSFLPGEDPAALTPTTPLITGGILDSLATLELVSFLEERYGIELEAHEVDASRLGTLNDIAKLVQTKTAAKTA